MAVLTNVSPYFDDFNEDKNFVRVLFKPGVAVQARELTQAQTILQNQVKSVGNFLFKDGSKVTGPTPSVNLDARTIRLNAVDPSGTALNVSTLANTYVTAQNSNVIGYVEFTYAADDPMPGDVPSLVVSLKKFNSIDDGMFDQETSLNFYNDYTNALTSGTPDYTAVTASDITKNAISTTDKYSTSVLLSNPTTIIEVGDLVVHPSITKKIYVTEIKNTLEIIVNEAPGVSIGGENISYVKKATCPTSIVTQDDAVFYKFGFFAKALKQKIVPDKNTAYPTKLLALLADQQIITSDDDNTLLDPALESSNYLAPGADRLKIDLNITAIDLVDGKADTTDDVIPLLYFNKGKIEYVKEVTVDNTLDRKLAERTYDESGSYVVDTFKITPVQTSEANTFMTFSIGAGKAYVGGEQVRTVGPTEITVPKPSTTETKISYNINTIQGNYYKISNVSLKLPKTQELTAAETYVELHNTRRPTSANTRVGVLQVKGIEHDSYLGSGQSINRLYYYKRISENDIPATWAAWSTKFGISSDEGQYIANVLYYSNDLLGSYGAGQTRFYGLFREPDTFGVAKWHQNWITNNKDIEKTKEAFALSFVSGDADYTRVRSNAKTYSEVINFSPFYDGLTDVKKVRSIVGVANQYTSHGTGASYVSPFFYADIADSGVSSTGQTIVFDQRPADKLVFPTYKKYVKTVRNIKSEYNFIIQNAIFASGVYSKALAAPETYVLGDGVIPASTARNNFSLLVKSGATANISTGLFNFERGTVTISGDSSTLSIDVGDPSFTGICDLSIRIQNDDITPRTKTLVSNQTRFLTIDKADTSYSLRKSDIYNVKGVFELPTVGNYIGVWNAGTSYTYNDVVVSGAGLYQAKVPTSNVTVSYANAWTTIQPINGSYLLIDNGQRDFTYDHGSVTFVGPTSSIPGDVIVIFDYFTHSGNGPITVESYPVAYSSIPIYRSVVDSNEYNLRDSIDFRPRRIDDSTYDNYDPAIIPAADVTSEIDVTYYLGRKDRIYVTNSLQNYDTPFNKFLVEYGIEEVNPKETENYSDLTKLSLAVLELPPYVNSVFDVKITYDDNKRYTMKDIGKIDDLTIRLDKAVKLHSIEIANIKSIVTNDQGDVLLKSGILVESFADISKADLTNGYFSCIIDTNNRTCFPSFNAFNLDLEVLSDTDIYQFSDLITMRYTEEILVSQLEGNSLVNPNPGAINDGRGRAVLSKKNSLAVNLLMTGGMMLAGMIASKTFAAYQIAGTAIAEGVASLVTTAGSGYAASAAVAGEGLLSVAWGAARDVGASVLNAFNYINGVSTSVSTLGSASAEAIALSGAQGVTPIVASSDIYAVQAGLTEVTKDFGVDWYASTYYNTVAGEVTTSTVGTLSSSVSTVAQGAVNSNPQVATSILESSKTALSEVGTSIVSGVTEAYLTVATPLNAALTSGLEYIGFVESGATIAGFATPIIIAVAAFAIVDWLSDACFITTAVCKYDNKEDDCEELMELRKFRDRYMLKDFSKNNIMHEYYNTAPYLVSKIERHKDKDEIYKTIRDTYIKPAVIACKEMNDTEAERIYTSMMTWVKNKV